MYNSDKKVVEDMWTRLIDAQRGMDPSEQTRFLNSLHAGMTNREVLAIVGELFTLRIAVDAMKEKLFPGNKDR